MSGNSMLIPKNNLFNDIMFINFKLLDEICKKYPYHNNPIKTIGLIGYIKCMEEILKKSRNRKDNFIPLAGKSLINNEYKMKPNIFQKHFYETTHQP
jgi:hypothetical protein